MSYDNSKNGTLSFHHLSLFLIFASAVFLRLYHLWEPVPTYWNDFAIEIVAPRNVLDFHQNHWVFDVGRREPFFTYFVAFLWLFLPSAKGLVIQRLACVLLNLITLWVLYLVGKELNGRRAGVLLAALGAVNLDLLVKCLLGIRIASLPLAVSLLVLFTLRFIRKPDLSHSAQWAATLAFGLYTYTVFRVFPPFIIPFVWLAIEKGILYNRQKAWNCLFLIGFFFYYAIGNNLLNGGFFNDWIADYTFQVLSFLFMLLACWKFGQEGAGPLFYWSVGVVLASLFMFPMLAQRAISEHMASLSIFTQSMHGIGGVVSTIGERFFNAFRLLMGNGGDRSDLSPPGSSMLEKGVTGFALLGSILAILKLDRKGLFLAAAAGAGLLPFLLTSEPHSGKLSGFVIPALALAVLGIEQILESGVLKAGGPLGRGMVIALLLGWWGWTINSHLLLVYRQWPLESSGVEVAVYHQAEKDLENHEVYFASSNDEWFGWASQGVMQEGRTVHPLGESNGVALNGDKPISSIVVYLSPQDKANYKRILNHLPAIVSSIDGSKGQNYFWRVEIPINEIKKKSGKLFFLRDTSGEQVDRSFYGMNYGLGRGLARGEDWVSSSQAPILTWVKKGFGVQLEWEMNLAKPGKIKTESACVNPMWWRVDGRPVSPGQVFAPGKHLVKCFVRMEKNFDLPGKPALSGL